ncbi:MBOAT family protein [Roseburia hominis]
MLFSSVTFLFTFLPITLLIYYLVPRKGKNVVLLICSLLFYAWGEPVYLFLMVISILFNYFSGIDIARNEGRPGARRRSLVFTVVVNLLILGFFKYYGFVLENLNAVLPFHIPYRELALPIGISFYTFQTLSYIIDVYRGKVPVQVNPIDFGAYVSMFPQLIAGPIVRYADVEKQLKDRQETWEKFGQGVIFFIIGLAKKILLANTIGAIHTEITGMADKSVLTAWLGALAFTFQIYFDFSGYSDMAVGLGKMFGFEFIRNFNYPYISHSVTEFWRRWHISLGSWFREYVYIPLGGNRVSVPRHLLNLLIVWFLTGLWHGASWNFVAWGMYYGLILIIEKYVTGRLLAKLPEIAQIVYNMLLVIIGWVFFFSPGLSEAVTYLGNMVGAGAAGIVDREAFYLITTHWLLWVMVIVGSTPVMHRLVRVLCFDEERPRTAVCSVLYMGIFLLSIAYLVTETYNPFLYFRF